MSQNKPTSKKVEKVLEELAKPSQRNLVEDIYRAVDAVVAAANVPALSDSEKAEVFFYIGSKIQSCSVI